MGGRRRTSGMVAAIAALAVTAATLVSTPSTAGAQAPAAIDEFDVVAIDVAPAPARFDTLTLTFSRAVDPATFTIDDVAVPGVDVVSVTPVDADTFAVALDAPAADANHSLTVGPNVTDTSGVALDDDRNGTPGQVGDEFDALLVGQNASIAPASADLTDRHVVVTDAALTVDGPHLLDGLDVAEGGIVTHTAFTAGGTGLDLDARHQVRVLAGGSIDATKLGRGQDLAHPGSGGSHGGEASDAVPGTFPQPTYGDFRQPTEPGRAGGNATYSQGTGGGVVMVSAGDRIIIDGIVSADGEDLTTQRATPSGGSVLLGAPAIDGVGEVTADGGSSPFTSTAFAGLGSGGRIALRATDVADSLVANAAACGGAMTVAGSIPPGGAGTLFVEEAGVGQLIVDGCGATGAADTPIGDDGSLVAVVDDLVVRDGGVASLVTPLRAGTLSLTNGAKLTHPVTPQEGELPGLRTSVTGAMTVDATSTVDVSHRGTPVLVTSRSPSTWPASTLAGGYNAGGSYGGSSDPRDSNAPYGDATFPNELGSAAWGSRDEYQSSSAGGLVQLAVGSLLLDGAIHSDGQGGTSYSCGPSCRSYSYGGSGGGVLVHAGSISGSGSVTATGGDGGGDFADDHGSGGRVAIEAVSWAGFTPAQATALPGGLGRPTPTRAEAGTVVTSGARSVGWTRPFDSTVVDDELIVHDSERLEWFAPAGTVGDVSLVPLEGGAPTVLATGAETPVLDFDTTTVPNGRYRLTITARLPGGAVVGTDMRDLVVTNFAGVTWFEPRRIDVATTMPGGLVLFDHDVVVTNTGPLTIPAGATYKFAPGVGISIRPGNLTVGAGVVATSWADDSVGGDTNLDGDATAPGPGDWSGIRGNGFDATEGVGAIDPTAVIHYDVVNLTGNLPDGFVFGADRTYHTWRRAGSFDTYSSVGETVTFEAGAVLKGNYNASIDLDGRTEFLTTPEQPAIFTSRFDDTVGGDLNRDNGYFSPAPGDNFEFEATNPSPIRNLEIRYAGGLNSPVLLQAPAGERLVVDGLVVRDAMAGGVALSGTGVDVTNSVIDDVPGGLRVTGSSGTTSTIVSSTVDGGTTGVVFSGTNADLDIVNSSITDFATVGVTAAANRVVTNHSNIWSSQSTTNHSAVQPAGTGNLSVDPLYRDDEGGDLSLLNESPLVDAGDGTRAPATDVLGRPRVDAPAPNTGVPSLDGWFPDLGAYEVQAEADELAVTAVSPSTASNIGPVTFTIDGSKFTAGTTVQLVQGATALDPTDLQQVHSGRLSAQFDLTGVATGPWDVVVGDGAASATLEDGVTVVAGGQPGRFEVTFTVPEVGRDWIAMPAVVTWRNVGDTDLDAPLIGARAEGARFFRPGTQELSDVPVEVLAGSRVGSPNRLAPGEGGTQTLRYDIDDDLGPNGAAQLSVDWWGTTDDEPIDWAARKDALQPDDVSDGIWDTAWPVFLELVGEEYGAYATQLGRQAAQPESEGERDVAPLVDLLIGDALDQAPMISGTLVDGGGAPAPGRIVTARAADGSAASAITDDEGGFAIAGLTTGTFALAVDGGTLTRAAIARVDDAPVEGLALRLAPAGSLSGEASVDGAPAADTTVRVTHDGERGVAQVQTAADGSFAVSGLVPGSYRVVLLDGSGGVITTATAVVRASEDTPVTLTATGGAVIEGTVTSSGDGQPDLDVQITQLDGDATTTVRTDADGDYTTAGRSLPPGEYVVAARSDDRGARDVLTAAAGENSLDLALAGGEPVAGIVTDADGEPVVGALVRVDGPGRAQSVVTDTDGEFEIEATEGDRTLFVEVPGYQLVDDELNVPDGGTEHDVELDAVNTLTVEVVDGDGQPLAGVPVDVLPDDGSLLGGLTGDAGTLVVRNTTDTRHRIHVLSSLSPGTVLARDEIDLTDDATVTIEVAYGTVAGTITRGGAPVEGARVSVVRDTGELAAIGTDADGTYEFTVLDGEPVDLVVVDGAEQAAARDIDVDTGAQVEHDLAIDDGEPIDVVVRDAGSPVERAGVTLIGTAGEEGGASAVTDATGEVHLTSTPGTYTLRVTSLGRVVNEQEVVVATGGADLVVDLVSDARFEGDVGEAGVRIVGVHESGVRASTVTGADGRYLLGGFPAGEVTLTAAITGRPPMEGESAIAVVGVATTVDLTVPPVADGVELSGVVSDADGMPVAGARVQVIDENGQAADRDLTGVDGQFVVLGADAPTELRASLGGVAAAVEVDPDTDPVDAVAIELPQAAATANPFRVGDGAGGGADTGAADFVGPASARTDVDAFFGDLSRLLDYRDFPPPAPLGPDMDPLYDTRWSSFAPALEDCPELGPLYQEAASRAKHLNSSYAAWQSAADAASIETGADLGEVLSEGAIVGLETTKYLAEFAEFYKPAGMGQAFKNDVTDMGGGVVENAKLSHLLKGSGLSDNTIGRLDTQMSLAVSVMQDSTAKFMAGDWDAGVTLAKSMDMSDLNALKAIVGTWQDAGNVPPVLSKLIDTIELIDKWQKFIEKQDAAFNDTGPASRYVAAHDNYIQAVKDYQSALNALSGAAGDCPPPPPPPDPPGPECESCTVGPKPTRPQRPIDPNEIVGPDGAGADRWVTSLDDQPYLVLFENLPAAGAPAIIVDITLPLDDDVDLASIEFTGLGWGGTAGPMVTVDGGAASIDEEIDIAGPAVVQVLAEVDDEARELHWRFEARDEETGELYVDGFLPPNDPSTHVGEGWVDLRLSGEDGLTTGATLTEQASIVFDTEAAIETNIWVNRLDTTPPAATVDALPATVTTTSFPVSWTGNDDGSGVATYDVHVSADGGPFSLWLDDTALTSANYAGVDGVTYAFEAVATDAVGLEESISGVGEASTTVDAVVVPGGCHSTPFIDVLAGHPFCDDIAWLYDEGISTGTPLPGGTALYKPSDGVSRQAMAAFLYRLAGSPAVDLTTPRFDDVPSGHPFYAAIQWMGETGNSTGTPNPPGKPLYKPSDGVSRQAMAAFLYRAADSPALPGGAPPYFSDVSPGHPFYTAIQWMGTSEVSTGFPLPTGKPQYRPVTVVSRQAMAAFLHRFDDLP